MAKPIGYCLCGALRYAFDPGKVSSPDICHCADCRRATASPVTAGFAVPDTAWRWTRGIPRIYRSSPGVARSFCATCGTQMAYACDDLPGETHLYIATLEDPETIRPETQSFAGEALSWIEGMLALPRRS